MARNRFGFLIFRGVYGYCYRLFITGDSVSGTDQSMKVKNYPFVYPRSFVGTWIIKYQ